MYLCILRSTKVYISVDNLLAVSVFVLVSVLLSLSVPSVYGLLSFRRHWSLVFPSVVVSVSVCVRVMEC